jgi:hypothetical protein
MRGNGGAVVIALLLVGLAYFVYRKKGFNLAQNFFDAQNLFNQADLVRKKLGQPGAQISIGDKTIGGNNPALIEVPPSELPPAFSPGFSQGPTDPNFST